MAKEACNCEVKCRKCDTWFPYPLRFSFWEEYYTGKPPKKLVTRCPGCGEDVELTKETVREAKERHKKKEK